MLLLNLTIKSKLEIMNLTQKIKYHISCAREICDKQMKIKNFWPIIYEVANKGWIFNQQLNRGWTTNKESTTRYLIECLETAWPTKSTRMNFTFKYLIGILIIKSTVLVMLKVGTFLNKLKMSSTLFDLLELDSI